MTRQYIDSHVHLWQLTNKINNWIKPDSVLYKDNLLVDYKRAGFKADQIVLIEAASSQYSIDELVWFESEFNHSNTSVRYISYIDLLQESREFKCQLAKFDDFKPRLVGFRQILATTNQYDYSPCDIDFTLDLNLLNNFIINCHVLDEYGYILELQLYPQQFKHIQHILLDLPIKIIFEHCGLPCIDDLSLWFEVLDVISQSDNLYLKVSGLDINNNLNNTKELVRHIIQRIDISKLLLGSNHPFISYLQFIDILNLFDSESLEKIYQNSVEIYHF